MIISERIIKVLKERNMTQAEFAKQVGISTSTISEWKKRKTNPTVDKIMDICNVLQITPDQLLTGKIFFVDRREISFEKDNVPFSEEIVIHRGYDLIEKLSDEKEFLTAWREGLVPECTRDIIEIA